MDAINRQLRARELAPYVEAKNLPGVYQDGLFGRSALDHDSARLLVGVATMAAERSPVPHLELLVSNPYRVAYVPRPLSVPAQTDFVDRIGGADYAIGIGSAEALLQELLAAAPLFGIPLAEDVLTDETARRINAYEPLREGDSTKSEAADHRTTWLLLHEGARLAVSMNLALSLAG